ncbi:MAG: hypothetical protein MJ232_09095 [archaeon]|nr:hypothetical protein [archaeon]
MSILQGRKNEYGSLDLIKLNAIFDLKNGELNDIFTFLSSYAEKMKNTSKFDEINKGIKPKEKELVSK